MKRVGNSRLLMNPSPTDLKRKLGFLKESKETDENKGHPQSTFTSISAASKNKILGERNANDVSNTHLVTTSKEKLVINSQETHPLLSKIHSSTDSSPSAPYDPVNNYTSPRPAFLRYNPNWRREILLRMKDEEVSLITPTEDDPLSVSSSHEEIQEDEEECSDIEVDEFEEQKAEEKMSRCSRRVLKWLLLFGIFLLFNNYLFSTSSSSSPFQEKLPSNEGSVYQHLLRIHMGLSSECLAIGEGMCDLFSQGDSQMGHLGESLMNDFVGSDEANGVLSLDEVEESVEDLMYRDSIQNVEESVTLDEREEPKNSQESSEQEWDNRKEEGAKKENLENETIENGEDLVIEKESEEPSISHESIDHEWRNIQREESAKEDGILVNEATDILGVSDDSYTYNEALIGTNTTLEVEGEVVRKNSMRWKHVLEFAMEIFQSPLLSFSLLIEIVGFLSLILLTGIVGLLSVLFKYTAKFHKKSSRIDTKDSNLNPPPASNHCSEEREESFAVPRSQSADEKRIYPSVSVMEEVRTEGGKDSNVNNFHLPSSSSVSGFYATKPPTVEWLGEFSFVDSVQTRKNKRQDEPKIYIFEEPRSERKRMVKIKPSTSSNEKKVNSEVTDEKSGGKKTGVMTPLRRSNRLQNRVTSPSQ